MKQQHFFMRIEEFYFIPIPSTSTEFESIVECFIFKERKNIQK
jgi:hypothetical protein